MRTMLTQTPSLSSSSFSSPSHSPLLSVHPLFSAQSPNPSVVTLDTSTSQISHLDDPQYAVFPHKPSTALEEQETLSYRVLQSPPLAGSRVFADKDDPDSQGLEFTLRAQPSVMLSTCTSSSTESDVMLSSACTGTHAENSSDSSPFSASSDYSPLLVLESMMDSMVDIRSRLETDDDGLSPSHGYDYAFEVPLKQNSLLNIHHDDLTIGLGNHSFDAVEAVPISAGTAHTRALAQNSLLDSPLENLTSPSSTTSSPSPFSSPFDSHQTSLYGESPIMSNFNPSIFFGDLDSPHGQTHNTLPSLFSDQFGRSFKGLPHDQVHHSTPLFVSFAQMDVSHNAKMRDFDLEDNEDQKDMWLCLNSNSGTDDDKAKFTTPSDLTNDDETDSSSSMSSAIKDEVCLTDVKYNIEDVKANEDDDFKKDSDSFSTKKEDEDSKDVGSARLQDYEREQEDEKEGQEAEEMDEEEEYHDKSKVQLHRTRSSARTLSKEASLSSAPHANSPARHQRSERKVTPYPLSSDAPIQRRTYTLPSKTSKKVLPKAMARGLKGTQREKLAQFIVKEEQDHQYDTILLQSPSSQDREQRSPQDDVTLGSMNSSSGGDGSLPEEIAMTVLAKRTQNTLAARKSRERKAAYLRELEEIKVIHEETIRNLLRELAALKKEVAIAVKGKV